MQRVHFIGIGGTGLSAIARLLAERGVSVSGSDRVLSPLAQDLSAAGIRVSSGHSAENITGASVIVRSSAVPDDNPEVVAARALGIPVLKRSEFLGKLLEDKQVDCGRRDARQDHHHGHAGLDADQPGPGSRATSSAG